MAKYAVGLLVLLELCSLAFAFLAILPDDPEYQDICPPDVKNINVLTRDKCDLRTYVMCFEGVPKVAIKCSDGTPRFNEETNYCDYERNVPLPRGCERQVASEAPITSCSQGALYFANPGTCRSFWVCQGDGKVQMLCNRFSYYIHGRCRFDMFPYRKAIDQDELARCRNLDPWTVDEDLGTV